MSNKTDPQAASVHPIVMGTSWFKPSPSEVVKTYKYLSETELHVLHLSAGGHSHRGSVSLHLFKAFDDADDWTFKCSGLGIAVKLSSDLSKSKNIAVSLVKQTLERLIQVIGDGFDCEMPERFKVDVVG